MLQLGRLLSLERRVEEVKVTSAKTKRVEASVSDRRLQVHDQLKMSAAKGQPG